VSHSDDEYRKNADFCWQQAKRTRFPEMKADWLRLARLWMALIHPPIPEEDPRNKSNKDRAA
jgi:hypothetical protein